MLIVYICTLKNKRDVRNNQKMKKHKDQPLWRDHYELIRDTKSIRNKLKFNFWVIDHFVYKNRIILK